jgi:hypothetical protein
MEGRDARLVENQEKFRSANERLEELASRANVDGEVIGWLCECADESCLGRIDLTLVEYETAHLLSDSYVVLSGHMRVENEDVAEDRGFYQVVQKG